MRFRLESCQTTVVDLKKRHSGPSRELRIRLSVVERRGLREDAEPAATVSLATMVKSLSSPRSLALPRDSRTLAASACRSCRGSISCPWWSPSRSRRRPPSTIGLFRATTKLRVRLHRFQRRVGIAHFSDEMPRSRSRYLAGPDQLPPLALDGARQQGPFDHSVALHHGVPQHGRPTRGEIAPPTHAGVLQIC